MIRWLVIQSIAVPFRCGYNESMSTLTFDRLAYLETLKASGIPEAQARAHAVALDDAFRDTVATKYDLELLKRDLTIRLGSMIMTLGGVLIAIHYFG